MPTINQVTDHLSRGNEDIKLRIVERYLLDPDGKMLPKYFIQVQANLHGINSHNVKIIMENDPDKEKWSDVHITPYPDGMQLSTAEAYVKQMLTKDKVIKVYSAEDIDNSQE